MRFFTFYFVFGILLEPRQACQNFAIHLFAGMVLVHYFTETVNSGTRSLLSNKGVVQKMAMPRELFPFASMLVSLYHTIPQLIILTIACMWTRTWIPDLEGIAAALARVRHHAALRHGARADVLGLQRAASATSAASCRPSSTWCRSPCR